MSEANAPEDEQPLVPQEENTTTVHTTDDGAEQPQQQERAPAPKPEASTTESNASARESSPTTTSAVEPIAEFVEKEDEGGHEQEAGPPTIGGPAAEEKQEASGKDKQQNGEQEEEFRRERGASVAFVGSPTSDEESPPPPPHEAWTEHRRSSLGSTRRSDRGEDSWLDEELPIDFIVGEIEQDVRDGYLVRELYIFIPFLLLFLAFSLNQIKVEPSHMAVQALRESISLKYFQKNFDQNVTLWDTLQAGEFPSMSLEKTHFDVANDEDWNDWFRATMMTLFHCGNLAQNDPNTTQNRQGGLPIPIKGQLYFAGALRLRTLRMRPDSCTLSDDVTVDKKVYPSYFNLTDPSCFAVHDNDLEEKTPRCGNPTYYSNLFSNMTGMVNLSHYTYTDCDDTTGSWTTTEQGYYRCGGYILEIPFSASCAEAMSVVDLLQDPTCPFVDMYATRFVTMELFAYTPALDTFFSVKIFNEVLAGGGWIPSEQFRAFLIFTPSLIFQTVLDFIFLAFVLYYIVAFFVNMRTFYREERSIWRYFLDLWTMVEFVNVVTYMAVFILRWMWWAESNMIDDIKFPFPDRYPPFDDTLLYYAAMRNGLAFNFILTFLKILKYLKISSKLNVISVTFEKAWQDVIGLLVIFLLLLTGYSVAGMVLFGPQMWRFSTMDRAFAGLMFMLLGEMDYMAMKAVNPVLAPFYFWTFLILSFFLLLNFIVAVVSEAFNAAGEQEWTLPLSEAAQLSLQSALRNYGPRALARECRYLCKGRSSLGLRKSALAYLVTQRAYLRMRFLGATDIPVKAKEIIKWIPVTFRDDYRPLFKDDWAILTAVWTLRMASDEEKAERINYSMILEGAQRVIRTVDLETELEAVHNRVLALDEVGKKAIDGLRRKLGKEDLAATSRRRSEGASTRGTAIGRLKRGRRRSSVAPMADSFEY